MAELDGDVHRLDGGAEQVDHVESLRQPRQVLVVGKPSRASASLQVMHIGRAADGGDGQAAPADHHVALRPAPLQHKGAGRRREFLLNQVGLQPHHRFGVDQRAGGFQAVPRGAVQDPQAGGLENG